MLKGKRIALGVALGLAVLVGIYLIMDALLFDGVKPQEVTAEGIVGAYYAPPEKQNRPAVLIIGGGQWGAHWGQEFARAQYPALSLPYHRQEGLPPLLEEIPLAYFEKALKWLGQQAEVNAEQIVVMGASRNAELALLVASYYPNVVHGVIAFSPSAVSWSNTVHPFHSGETKPTFTFQNNPVPFIAMPPLTAGTSDTIATLPYWYSGLDDSAAVANAFIPIQQITGPVLLLSGEEDAVWPSAMMGNMLMERLAANDFKYAYQHVVYPNAGHLISGNPNYTPESQFGSMPLDGNAYVYGFGGSPAGDKAAQVDAANQVFRFLEAL